MSKNNLPNYKVIAMILRNEHRDIEIAEKCHITRERVRQIRNSLKAESVLPDPYSENMIAAIVACVANEIRKENVGIHSDVLTRKQMAGIRKLVSQYDLKQKVRMKIGNGRQNLAKRSYLILKELIDGKKPTEVANLFEVSIGWVRQIAWNAQQAKIIDLTYKPRGNKKCKRK